MDVKQMMEGIRTITDSLRESETSLEAIRVIEQLQASPDSKMNAVSEIVNRTEQTKEEAFRQIASLLLHAEKNESEERKR